MSGPPLRVPRPVTLQRDIEATRVVAYTCSRLPVPFWQRRLAARAFGAPTLPPVDRGWSGGASLRRLRLGEPLFVLQTSTATWALSPGGRHELQEVRDVLNDLDGPTDCSFVGVLGVVCDPQVGHPAPLLAAPRIAGRIEPCVGLVSWSDAAAVFQDGLTFTTSRATRDKLAMAVNSLQLLHAEWRSSAPEHAIPPD